MAKSHNELRTRSGSPYNTGSHAKVARLSDYCGNVSGAGTLKRARRMRAYLSAYFLGTIGWSRSRPFGCWSDPLAMLPPPPSTGTSDEAMSALGGLAEGDEVSRR